MTTWHEDSRRASGNVLYLFRAIITFLETTAQGHIFAMMPTKVDWTG
jgi:hypothetical protein